MEGSQLAIFGGFSQGGDEAEIGGFPTGVSDGPPIGKGDMETKFHEVFGGQRM